MRSTTPSIFPARSISSRGPQISPIGGTATPAEQSASQPHRAVGFEAEQELPDGLEMLLPPLQLLRDGVDVTKSPLEWVFLEDRGRPGRVVGGIDNLERLVNRKGRCEPDHHALVESDPAGAPHFGRDLLQRAQQKGACRSKTGLGLRNLRLDQVVVAQGAL